MKNLSSLTTSWLVVVACLGLTVSVNGADRVRTEDGLVEAAPSSQSEIRVFKGIPFAAPPVGDLRWQAPQPVRAWQTVRKADTFGPRCMQGAIYSDMVFRDAGPSEDCLYLNVWTPAKKADAALPVMVWIFGGGFQAGAASEPRQDGEQLAKKGVVVVSMNYRLGLFGFFAHPELTKESSHHASGNYGLMDQTAALQWVKNNIGAFGGDPGNVTIFGESAGSMSVSAQMASPLAHGLFTRCIGESGAVFPFVAPIASLQKAEEMGADFAQSMAAPTLAALRAKPAKELLDGQLAVKSRRFSPSVDTYFFPQTPSLIFEQGQQAHVALLAGWNADEQSAEGFFGKDPMTKQSYDSKLRQEFPEHADEMLKLYPDATPDEMKASARDLASDRFIAYSTWKWIDEQISTGKAPAYRYHFEQVPPVAAGEKSRGSYHSSDIKYVFATLESEPLDWTAADKHVSEMVSSYWSNFAKTGDPNGPGLPKWQPSSRETQHAVMHLRAEPKSEPEAEQSRARYELLDRIAKERSRAHAPLPSND